ncbi:winged helix-turn-helix domain-containing protein [Streptomyces sp. cg2]|uniref:helix-turn-helix domain-containing protein n=1 Tax=Streptomyces sp. cg2 TaxID=3238799 RepID=UPI0034E2ADE4
MVTAARAGRNRQQRIDQRPRPPLPPPPEPAHHRASTTAGDRRLHRPTTPTHGIGLTPHGVGQDAAHWRDLLAAELEKGPAARGWVDDRCWTLARVATVIARRFPVRFSTAQTWRVLHQMGFTVQVPLRRAVERDQDAVATWLKETWPRVEGRCGTRTRGGASPTSRAR